MISPKGFQAPPRTSYLKVFACVFAGLPRAFFSASSGDSAKAPRALSANPRTLNLSVRFRSYGSAQRVVGSGRPPRLVCRVAPERRPTSGHLFMITTAELRGFVTKPRLTGLRRRVVNLSEMTKRERNHLACMRWRAKNRERVREYNRAYYASRPELKARAVERLKRHKAENPERFKALAKARTKRYLARKRAA